MIEEVEKSTKNTSGGARIGQYNFFKSEKDFNEKIQFQEEMTNSMKNIETIHGNHTKHNTTRKIKNLGK